MPDGIDLKRIIDLDPETTITNDDYTIVDSSGGVAKKFALGAELNNLKSELNDKLDEPSTPGTSGQVLTSDGLGGQTWQTPQGGGGSGLTTDIKDALLQIASKVAYIDDDGQDYYNDLFSALYPVASISAVFTQGDYTVFSDSSLDELKKMLVVTATYENGSTEVIDGSKYALSGTLSAGTSTVTATYAGKTGTFSVNVTSAEIPTGYTRYGYIKRKTTTALSVNSQRWIVLNNQTDLSVLSVDVTMSATERNPSTTNDQAWLGVRNTSDAATSYSFYRSASTDYMAGWIHGVKWISDDAITLGVKNHVGIRNTENSPSVAYVNDQETEFTWTETPTIAHGFVLLTNPQYNTTNNMALAPNVMIGDIILRKLNGECVGYYVPTVNNGVIGMYDFISGQFYSSSTASYSTIANSNCIYAVGDW